MIGVDLGTTSAKAAVFDTHDEVVVTSAREVETFRGEDGRAEQDPQEIAAAALYVLVEAAQAAVAQGYEVQSVGFSAAMHSLMALDANGDPMTKASIWMDARPNADAIKLRETNDWRTLYEATGTPIHAMSPLIKLLWLRRKQPELFARTARFVSLKEYVWAQWFDEWAIDESMAGATGLYSLQTRDWDAAALQRAGVDASQLSRIVPTTYLRYQPVHASLRRAGLGDTAFNIGASDGVLANLGVGATDSSSMVLTIGTSCAVRLTTNQPHADVNHQPFSYVLDENHYVVGGPSNSGGVVMDWMANSLLLQAGVKADGGRDTDLNHLFEAAASVETGNLICLPYMAGERAPLWNADMSGALIGLQLHHGPAHVFRATLEGILLNAYWIAQSLIATGHQPQQMVASGKLLGNGFVRQLCADIFNLPVVGCEDADASVRGAAMLAQLATGTRSYTDFGGRVYATRTTPEAAMHSLYMEKYAQFRRLCSALAADISTRSGRDDNSPEISR